MMALDDDQPEHIEMDKVPSGKDFWIIHAHTQDWNIILHNFILEVDPSHGKEPMDPKVAFIGFAQGTATPIYYLSREYFPVERMARLLGKPVEALKGIEVLNLREFKDAEGKPAQADWEKPSVNYWGRA